MGCTAQTSLVLHALRPCILDEAGMEADHPLRIFIWNINSLVMRAALR